MAKYRKMIYESKNNKKADLNIGDGACTISFRLVQFEGT